LTVKEERLIYEHLYDIDRTGEAQQQIVFSNDKQLIEESINANPPYEYTDNLLEMYPIDDDNITEIICITNFHHAASFDKSLTLAPADMEVL